MKLLLIFISTVLSLNLMAAGNHPCAEDMKKYCADKKGDKKAMVECMKSHENDLSATCKEKISARKEEMKNKIEKLKENCSDDAKKFCAEITPGKGAILKCLKSHENEVSDKCKSVLHK